MVRDHPVSMAACQKLQLRCDVIMPHLLPWTKTELLHFHDNEAPASQVILFPRRYKVYVMFPWKPGLPLPCGHNPRLRQKRESCYHPVLGEGRQKGWKSKIGKNWKIVKCHFFVLMNDPRIGSNNNWVSSLPNRPVIFVWYYTRGHHVMFKVF